jgi:hypothetical protein
VVGLLTAGLPAWLDTASNLECEAKQETGVLDRRGRGGGAFSAHIASVVQHKALASVTVRAGAKGKEASGKEPRC